MKTLKFTSDLAKKILTGEKTSTWRLFDDKDLKTGDELILIEKETGNQFAKALITESREKKFEELTDSDYDGQHKYANQEEMYEDFQKYYSQTITPSTSVKIINFKLMEEPFNIPLDINQNRIIISAPEKNRSLAIAIYKGEGSMDSGIENVKKNISSVLNVNFTELGPEKVMSNDLAKFDVVIFSGGGASMQGNAIGEQGRENVRKYIKNGGNYLGICAGAYLATSNFEWSLNIINAETISQIEWKRGQAFLDLEITEEGKSILGNVEGMFKCRYNNGPLLKPMNIADLPAYKVAAYFRSEISDNETTPGEMINTPAAVFSEYGKGKVFVISSHAENTPGLENFLPRAIVWLTLL